MTKTTQLWKSSVYWSSFNSSIPAGDLQWQKLPTYQVNSPCLEALKGVGDSKSYAILWCFLRKMKPTLLQVLHFFNASRTELTSPAQVSAQTDQLRAASSRAIWGRGRLRVIIKNCFGVLTVQKKKKENWFCLASAFLINLYLGWDLPLIGQTYYRFLLQIENIETDP